MPERSSEEVSENENDSAALDALRELAEALKKFLQEDVEGLCNE